ncbi:MAG: prepilin-type N-terminal cleavage/methylation domain-containing protein [Gemmataceae bacterium]
MSPARPTRRSGFSLVELMVVIAILVILAGLIAPNVAGLKRDTRVKAGADSLRGRISEARGQAMEDGRAYRMSVSADGKRLRLAPDVADYSSLEPQTSDIDPDAPLVIEEAFPEGVTVQPMLGDGQQPEIDGSDWIRVATFLPDGTCREDAVVIELREPGVYPILVRLRGLTGAASTQPQRGTGAVR